MKVTSEQLLNLFGLKVGDEILLQNSKYEIRDTTYGIVLTNYEFDSNIPLSVLCNEEYEIIKPKPKLTEDEKVILRNIGIDFNWIVRDCNDMLCWFHGKPTRTHKTDDWWCVEEDDAGTFMFDELFTFITKNDEEPYNIMELLDEET